MAFSIISAPGSPHYERVRQMENLAPPPEKRFAAMEKLAAAGIPTGISMMPILPGVSDDHTTLQNVIRWTADQGGQFCLAGSLTLADQQRDFFFGVLAERFPDLVGRYNALYPPNSYSPVSYPWLNIARQIRELCNRYGIRDRQPRPIIPGDKHTLNKRIVERLAEEVYALELDAAPPAEIWNYRKASWAVEDLEQDISLIYRLMGIKGIASIPGIVPAIASKILTLIHELTPKP